MALLCCSSNGYFKHLSKKSLLSERILFITVSLCFITISWMFSNSSTNLIILSVGVIWNKCNFDIREDDSLKILSYFFENDCSSSAIIIWLGKEVSISKKRLVEKPSFCSVNALPSSVYIFGFILDNSDSIHSDLCLRRKRTIVKTMPKTIATSRKMIIYNSKCY